MHPRASLEEIAPDVDVPVCVPRTGVKTASGVRELGVGEFVVLEVRTGVATRARGAGGRRLQANELAAAVQDKQTEMATSNNLSTLASRSIGRTFK